MTNSDSRPASSAGLFLCSARAALSHGREGVPPPSNHSKQNACDAAAHGRLFLRHMLLAYHGRGMKNHEALASYPGRRPTRSISARKSKSRVTEEAKRCRRTRRRAGRKRRSFSKSFRVWSQFGPKLGPKTKKVRAYKALTWRFNGAGDGNRTRVRSLEGFSSTIEPHPRMVGTTGFEPATSCSQSRRATKLRHVPSTVQLGYYNKARRMFKKISLNSRAPESPPPIQLPRE